MKVVRWLGVAPFIVGFLSLTVTVSCLGESCSNTSANCASQNPGVFEQTFVKAMKKCSCSTVGCALNGKFASLKGLTTTFIADQQVEVWGMLESGSWVAALTQGNQFKATVEVQNTGSVSVEINPISNLTLQPQPTDCAQKSASSIKIKSCAEPADFTWTLKPTIIQSFKIKADGGIAVSIFKAGASVGQTATVSTSHPYEGTATFVTAGRTVADINKEISEYFAPLVQDHAESIGEDLRQALANDVVQLQVTTAQGTFTTGADLIKKKLKAVAQPQGCPPKADWWSFEWGPGMVGF